MLKLKQGTAAIVLVATLGLLMPSTFGGPASADVNNSRGHNTNTLADLYYFDCDLDGDGIYNTRYDLASTFSANARHVQGSNLVLMLRYRFDAKDSYYEVVQDPTGMADDFEDPETYWIDAPGDFIKEHGVTAKGWKTVLCTNEGIDDDYVPNAEDVGLGIGFVQKDECLEYPSAGNPDCVVYKETFTNYWAVTLSEVGQRVAADSLDDSPSADRAHKAKKQDHHKHKKGGKHRGKGKRGR